MVSIPLTTLASAPWPKSTSVLGQTTPAVTLTPSGNIEHKVVTRNGGDGGEDNGGRGEGKDSEDGVHGEGGNHRIIGYGEHDKRGVYSGVRNVQDPGGESARYGCPASGEGAAHHHRELVHDHGTIGDHGPEVGHAAGSIESQRSDLESFKDPEPVHAVNGNVHPGHKAGVRHDHGDHQFEGLDIGNEKRNGPGPDPNRHSKGRYLAIASGTIIPSALTGILVGVAKHDLVAGFVVFGAVAGVTVVGIAGYFGLR